MKLITGILLGVVLVGGGVYYLLNNNVSVQDTAAIVNVSAQADAALAKCDAVNGLLTGEDWRECESYVNNILQDSQDVKDQEIARIRAEIEALMEEISTLEQN